MTFIEKFNLIMALIGCITGTLGFAISLYIALLESSFLNVTVLGKQVFTLNPFHLTFSDAIGNSFSEYSKEHCLIGVHVLITNVSKNPTSIYEISLNNEHTLNASCEHILKNYPLEFYINDNHLIPYKSFSYNVDGLKLVKRLEANEAIDCCLTFVGIPSHLQNCKKLKLSIKTSHTSKTISFKPNFEKFTVKEQTLLPQTNLTK